MKKAQMMSVSKVESACRIIFFMKNYKNEVTQSLVISENSIFSYDSLSYCHHKRGNDGNNCTEETGTIKPSYSLHQRKGFPRCHGLWFGRLLFFLDG